ncbi:exportin-4 protein [Citrus sinensis]|nr:exportin-4 protein [Citrus sinensis]
MIKMQEYSNGEGGDGGGGGGGPADLAKLQSIMHSIEIACSSIQVSNAYVHVYIFMEMHVNPAAAEATILGLCQSPQPYKACQFILENSQVANARFQAAAAIRDAAMREWSFLTADEKKSLIGFCLCFVMQHASSPEGYVQAKISSVAAQLMKRGWLDFTSSDKEAFFSQVHQAVLGIHGVDTQFIGINFLESLVSEFSPSTSSAMGLPREFHEQCRISLELDYLKTFYCWARDAALSVTKQIIESDAAASEVKACTAALRLLHQILNWDFQFDTSGRKISINVFSAGVRTETSSSKRSECIIVQPGPAWCDALISSGHIVWLLNLYSALRQKFSSEGYWLDCPIAVSARKLIVQLCSLTGTVFPSDNGKMQEHHLLQLLSGILEWVDPPDVVAQAIESGKSESEMLDGCRALLSIATVTTPFVFDRLLKSIRPFGTLSLLSNLMCEVVKVLMMNNTEEGTWSWEARDILLDTWTTLLVSLDSTGRNVVLPLEVRNAAASLFALIVESELKVASASAMDDNGEFNYLQASISAMDERLSSYALIARAAIDATVPLLTRLFSERVARLHQGRGMIDPTETLEELYSLLLITGHVLADEGEGEIPVAIVWFLARWSQTYLMPLEEFRDSSTNLCHDTGYQHQSSTSRKALLSFFGEHNQGKPVLDIIVRISMTTLVSYPGEKDLQELTCNQLLHALVRRKNVCVHLVALGSWRELASAFANDKTLILLNSTNQRSLAQTLVLSAYGMRNSESSNQYVRDLTRHATAYLVELSGKNDLKNVSQQPDIILLVSCLLERLRGAANATEPRTQKAIYEMGFSVMNPVLLLLEVYKHESAVVYLLLKFVVDWVDGQISYLEVQETNIVIDFCTRLLQLYSSHNIGKVDFSSDSIEAQAINISQVVFFGLHIVTPLMSGDLLKYPKLCHDYFSLLSHLLEVYPETVAQLSTEAFAHVLGTLDFGLHHQDSEIVDMCLRALRALASYHYKETGAGKVGLAAQAAGINNSNGNPEEGVLSRFLRSLLQLLLFEDYSPDMVGTAADALFPLILCEPRLYQRLGSELIERQANPPFKSRLANALQSLTSSNQLSSSLDRVNYQRFRKNLTNFLIEVRGICKKQKSEHCIFCTATIIRRLYILRKQELQFTSGVSFDIHHRIFGVNYGPFLNAKAALDYQNILSVAFSNI